MANPLNLIGNRYGALTVIERTENNKNGNTQWLCKCDCGNTKIALGYDLNHGRTTSCGCKIDRKGKPSQKRIDLVGKKFGKLTVISLNEEKTKNGGLKWNCLCECGNKTVESGSNLKCGHATHCGCSRPNAHNFIDLTGRKFGRLLVIEQIKRENKKVYWKCLCDCGNEKIVSGTDLRTGDTKSCGCLHDENSRKPKWFTHKMSNTRLYHEWRGMISRCEPYFHDHKNYYDIGVCVCDEWKDFITFKDWAINNGYDDSLTLDRYPNMSGNYEPSNCRWATMKEQQNNKKNNAYIEFNGVVRTLKEWSEYFGLNYGMLKARYRNGWTPPKLFEPKHPNRWH